MINKVMEKIKAMPGGLSATHPHFSLKVGDFEHLTLDINASTSD